MTDCIRPGCRQKDLHPVTVRKYDGCCSQLCEEIMDGVRKDGLIKELQAKLSEAQEQAFRDGYKAGSTAVNTVGVEALGHCEFHLEKWMEEKE